MQNRKFKEAVLGGTFDHFHAGHQKLLDTAFSNSEKVGIGIASGKLLKDKFLPLTIEDYKTRYEVLKAYLVLKGYLSRCELIEINDIYGNTLVEKDIDAIFATKDTLANVKKINKKRKELGFPALQIATIPYVLGEDDKIITSTRIRKGEIDRDGNSYFNLFAGKKRVTLPAGMKDQLRVPLGKVVKDIRQVKKFIDHNSLLVTIGDMVTVNLFMKGIRSDISVFDFKTRRHKISEEYHEILTSFTKSSVRHTVVNPAGTIERRAVGGIRKAINNYFASGEKQIIEVDGEEDLLAIPILLLSPLNSLVLYGQPGLGIIIVKVTEKKKKQEVRKLLDNFF